MSKFPSPPKPATKSAPNATRSGVRGRVFSLALVGLLLAAGFGAFLGATLAQPRATSGTLAVQSQPFAVAYVPTNHDLYVTSLGSSNVQVYGPAGVLLKTIPVGTGPEALAFDSATHQLFVADTSVDELSVIDTVTNAVVGTVGVGSFPIALAYDNLTNAVYVVNFGSDNISVIASGSTTASQTISLNPGDAPLAIAFDPDNGQLYVADSGSGRVSVIDGTSNSLVANVTTGGSPYGIAYDPYNALVYVSDTTPHPVNFHTQYNISVIDPAANVVVQTVGVGATPGMLYFDPVSADMLDSEYLSSSVLMISSSTGGGVASISVGISPYGMAYDAANSYIYVANYGSGTLSFFDARSFNPAPSIKPGGTPHGMAYDPLNRAVYLADSNGVLTINASTNAVHSLGIGTSVSSLVYDPATRELYASTGTYGSSVLAINASSNALLGSAHLGSTPGPEQLALDSANGVIYTANFWGHNITGFDPVTLQTVANISMYDYLENIAYDPANGYLFVSSFYSHNVSVVNPLTGAIVTNITGTYAPPATLLYSPATHDMYIADGLQVSVVSSVTLGVVATVLFYAEPQGLAYDPVNHDVVVGARNAIWWLSPSSRVQAEVYGTPDQTYYTSYFVGAVSPANNCVYLTTTTNQLVDIVRT